MEKQYNKLSWKFTIPFITIALAFIVVLWVSPLTPITKDSSAIKWAATIFTMVPIVMALFDSARGTEIEQEDTNYKGEAF